MGKHAIATPNLSTFRDEYFRRCNQKGEIQRFCNDPRKGAERGFPKDWKLNEHMHAVAADSRDSGCASQLASLEIQHSAYSVWARVIEKIIWLTPWVEAKGLQVQLDAGSAVSVMYGSDVEYPAKSVKLMKTDQQRSNI